MAAEPARRQVGAEGAHGAGVGRVEVDQAFVVTGDLFARKQARPIEAAARAQEERAAGAVFRHAVENVAGTVEMRLERFAVAARHLLRLAGSAPGPADIHMRLRHDDRAIGIVLRLKEHLFERLDALRHRGVVLRCALVERVFGGKDHVGARAVGHKLAYRHCAGRRRPRRIRLAQCLLSRTRSSRVGSGQAIMSAAVAGSGAEAPALARFSAPGARPAAARPVSASFDNKDIVNGSIYSGLYPAVCFGRKRGACAEISRC